MPNQLSLDDFAAIIAPQRFGEPGWSQVGKGPEPKRPIDSEESTRTLSLMNDNTVGPVTLASGYESNTFPYSAAHVLDSSTMFNEIHLINRNRVFNDEGLFSSCKYASANPFVTGSVSQTPPLLEIRPPKSSCFTLV